VRPAWCRLTRLRCVALMVLALVVGAAATAPALAAAQRVHRPHAGGRPHGGPVMHDAHAALRSVLDRAVREGSPGALAQVRWAGRVWTVSSGVADLRTRQRPSAGMHVRIGSITKTFVATVVLQLVAEGRLRLTDTVDGWLPGLVSGNGNNGHAITVRMLLNHTSGLYSYTSDLRLWQELVRTPFRIFTPPDLLRRYGVSHPPSFPAGTSWRYSNTNYLLLGLIVERVTGRSYRTEISRRILRPLGLWATYAPGASLTVRRPFMHGYVKGESGRIEDVTEQNETLVGAAGEMISTVGDLDRFDAALLGGRLLPADLLRQMLTPVPGSNVFPGYGPYRYGLGVMMVTLPCGVTVYGHGGTIFGSLSWVASTRDGRHAMSFDLNGHWVDQAALTTAATVAEFCPNSRASGSTSLGPGGTAARPAGQPWRQQPARSHRRTSPARPTGPRGQDHGRPRPTASHPLRTPTPSPAGAPDIDTILARIRDITARWTRGGG